MSLKSHIVGLANKWVARYRTRTLADDCVLQEEVLTFSPYQASYYAVEGATHTELWWKQFHDNRQGYTALHRTYLVENATIVGDTALILDAQGRVLVDNILGGKEYLAKSGDVKHVCKAAVALPRINSTLGAAISLVHNVSGNYYHWTMDILPRLMHYHQLCEQVGESIAVIVDRATPPFVEQQLRILGIPSEMILRWDGSPIRVVKMVVPAVYRDDQRLLPVYPQQVYDFFAGIKYTVLSGDVDKLLPKRFVIERRDQANRQIINASQLAGIKDKYGLASVYLEDLSVAEQIRLFSQAEFILAMHGAGLTNLIYVNHRAVIIELFPRPWGFFKNHFFYQMLSGTNIKYYLWVQDPIDDRWNLKLEKEQIEALDNILAHLDASDVTSLKN